MATPPLWTAPKWDMVWTPFFIVPAASRCHWLDLLNALPPAALDAADRALARLRRALPLPDPGRASLGRRASGPRRPSRPRPAPALPSTGSGRLAPERPSDAAPRPLEGRWRGAGPDGTQYVWVWYRRPYTIAVTPKWHDRSALAPAAPPRRPRRARATLRPLEHRDGAGP